MRDDRALRAADPAAGWSVDPDSPPAQAMLAAILDSPRPDSGPPPVRRRAASRRPSPRRAALGAAGLAVAVAAGAITATLWDSGTGGSTPAYAVTAGSDGTVRLLVRWEQLDDPPALGRALTGAGVPTVVRSAQPERYCTGSPAARDRAGAGLNAMAPGGRPASQDGYVLRPRLFPAGSTLVVASYDDPARQVHYVAIYLAPRRDTTCALTYLMGSIRYTGPTPYPSFMRFPGLRPAS